MNIQDAISIYLSDPTYENICNDSFPVPVKLICDRNTGRLYYINGYRAELKIEELLSDAWYVIRNE